MQIDKLCEAIKKTKCPVCVGLDTKYDYLPEDMKRKGMPKNKEMAELVYEFNCDIIDEISDIVPCVKVQAAYYEKYAEYGMKCFFDTMEYAKSSGLIVIADVKRNDIGATAKAYSEAYIQGSHADFITVNAYLGFDGIEPFIEDCKETGKGIFVLLKTSNASGGEFQDLVVLDEQSCGCRKNDDVSQAKCKGEKLYEIVADKVSLWGEPLVGENGYSSVGAVVGATYPKQAQELRARMKNTFFLVPGYGAQGAGADDIAVNFDENGLGAIVNSSRGILLAYKKQQYQGLSAAKAARQAVLDMKQDIISALETREIDL